MDERQLKDLLNNDVPVPDFNARKRAVNLALSEFSAAQQDSQKNLQGKSIWSRLTDRTNQNPRREKMNNKLVYGGMATAMVALFAVGATLPQLQDFRSPVAPTTLQNLKEAPGGKVSEPYARAIHEANEASVDAAISNSTSALPVPIGPSKGKVELQARASQSLMKPAPAEVVKDSIEMSKMAASAPAPAAAPPAVYERTSGAITTADPSEAVGGTTFNMVQPQIAIVGQIEDPLERWRRIQNIQQGHDKFEHIAESPAKQVKAEPVSTFSIDVDTASYSFIRKQLNAGVLPQKDAVRVEEMVNYFDYNYALPKEKTEPFQPNITVTPSPWGEGHKLVHIGIKGYDIPAGEKPHSNLVFLIDTSGSMNEQDKLPLLRNSFKLLLDTLKADDTISIVTYAGSAGVALEPTKVSDKAKIIAALDGLGAGGGTAGAEGIRTAYQLAEANLDKNGVNRVILATDGDFNIGITDHNELKSFIERERASGVFLSVLGFGQGNYNDQMMQDLAQNGNGVATYIDTLSEARKVLVQEASSTLFTIAKDVKIQVEFNPSTVSEYRLVGYETRALNKEDFNNDKVDAGDIGAGHAVTAIYDITPVGAPTAVDASRYAKAEDSKMTAASGNEYGFLKIRYKLPDGDTSKLITTPIPVAGEKPLANTKCPVGAQCLVADSFGASDDVRFSVAVVGFGQLLKGGKYTGKLTYDDVITMAQGAKGEDQFGYRAEFINLVRLAKSAQTLPTP